MQKEKEGICLFCVRKRNCTYLKPENGSIECDEYEEMLNNEVKTLDEIVSEILSCKNGGQNVTK